LSLPYNRTVDNRIIAIPQLTTSGREAALYRAFMLDRRDRVFAARTLTTENDADALLLACKLHAPCSRIEVWDGTRLLGSVEPQQKLIASIASPRLPTLDWASSLYDDEQIVEAYL
jgi:hypothetical protein